MDGGSPASSRRWRARATPSPRSQQSPPGAACATEATDADGDAAGIGLFMTSIGGFCVGLVSILVFLKLLQVGMNEINPKRYSIASVDEDDIPEPVVSGLTSPSDLEEMIPTQVGWLDDTEKIADVEEEFVHVEDDQNAVSTQIGWLDDID